MKKTLFKKSVLLTVIFFISFLTFNIMAKAEDVLRCSYYVKFGENDKHDFGYYRLIISRTENGGKYAYAINGQKPADDPNGNGMGAFDSGIKFAGAGININNFLDNNKFICKDISVGIIIDEVYEESFPFVLAPHEGQATLQKPENSGEIPVDKTQDNLEGVEYLDEIPREELEEESEVLYCQYALQTRGGNAWVKFLIRKDATGNLRFDENEYGFGNKSWYSNLNISYFIENGYTRCKSIFVKVISGGWYITGWFEEYAFYTGDNTPKGTDIIILGSNPLAIDGELVTPPRENKFVGYAYGTKLPNFTYKGPNDTPTQEEASYVPFDFCHRQGIIKTLSIINFIITVLKIVVPLLLIVFGSYDFFKAIIVSDDNAVKDGLKPFVIRLVVGVSIFFVPTLVDLILNLASTYGPLKETNIACYDCVFKGICNSTISDYGTEEGETE